MKKAKKTEGRDKKALAKDRRNSALEYRLRRLCREAGHKAGGQGKLASIRTWAKAHGLAKDIPSSVPEQAAWERELREAGRL